MHGSGYLFLMVTAFTVDNPHINAVLCLSSPLTTLSSPKAMYLGGYIPCPATLTIESSTPFSPRVISFTGPLILAQYRVVAQF
jgi:hypothetical protein